MMANDFGITNVMVTGDGVVQRPTIAVSRPPERGVDATPQRAPLVFVSTCTLPEQVPQKHHVSRCKSSQPCLHRPSHVGIAHGFRKRERARPSAELPVRVLVHQLWVRGHHHPRPVRAVRPRTSTLRYDVRVDFAVMKHRAPNHE